MIYFSCAGWVFGLVLVLWLLFSLWLLVFLMVRADGYCLFLALELDVSRFPQMGDGSDDPLYKTAWNLSLFVDPRFFIVFFP